MTAAVLVFAAVFLCVVAIFLLVHAIRSSPAIKVRLRLRLMQNPRVEPLRDTATAGLLRETDPAKKFLARLPVLGKLVSLVEKSGVRLSPVLYITLIVALFSLSFSAVYFFKENLVLAWGAAAVIALIPVALLQHAKQQRETRFSEQLPDVLTMIARSLRAGHALPTAVELVSQELPEPSKSLFRGAHEQQQLGMRVVDALHAMLGKIGSDDLHFFVTIVRINSESGGNLSEILDKLAETIRSRLQIRRQVKVYTAEGRLSGIVLVLLPVLLFLALYAKNPDYMRVFFTERVCQLSLGAAALAQVAGFLMIKKIISIRI